MKSQNLTSLSEFYLLAISEDPELQPILFGLFLSLYLVTVLGNLLIILAVSSDSHLHTPMYFFLCNLSLVDIGFISTTVPRMIVNIQTHSRVISYKGCLTQMTLFILFGTMDDVLLTVMAYDRFVAICTPLHYLLIMKPRFCVFLVLVSFFLGMLASEAHGLVVSQAVCFRDVEISSLFCHPSQVLNLLCFDNLTKNIIIYFVGAVFGFSPMLGILLSYYKVISSILKIPSLGGRYKAFSTCVSHLTVVCLFYGTGTWAYLGSAVLHFPRKGIMATIMYTVITPMLNPFIYSLRNKDIGHALRGLLNRTD